METAFFFFVCLVFFFFKRLCIVVGGAKSEDFLVLTTVHLFFDTSPFSVFLILVFRPHGAERGTIVFGFVRLAVRLSVDTYEGVLIRWIQAST